MELHGILENNEVVLDSNGKICSVETNKVVSKANFPKQDLVCSECNVRFSSEKTLTYHIKYKHNKTCTVYHCPDCKETLSNAWSVYRHLYKVHRRTPAQVRRLRTSINSTKIRKDQEPEKKKKVEECSESEENQWMSNFEGDKDLQMCGGCGKRFERKAALHSHSQLCTKRIAVCNSIKNTKMKPEKKVNEKIEEITVLKGAARRKPFFVTAYKKEEEEEKSEITITKDPLEHEEVSEKPEIEILTISDDSNDAPETEEDRNTLKRKRTNRESDSDSVQVSYEYKPYLNDETDNTFLAKALTYMDKTALKCIPCEANFLSIYLLLRHMSDHFSWFRFQCSKCSFMSFNKYDCTTHAISKHSVPNTLIESTVLPIPKWKVLFTSHEFKSLSQEMPLLEKCEEKNEEEIVLEDDEMPVLSTDTVVLSDEEKEKAGTSKIVSTRPIRNRMKSVKTVQADFIYDLAKVLKLDNSIKNKRVKKGLK